MKSQSNQNKGALHKADVDTIYVDMLRYQSKGQQVGPGADA